MSWTYYQTLLRKSLQLMTQENFLKKTRKAYLNARNYIYKPKANTNILARGTSHSISSITEDILGCYCVDKVSNPKNIKIIIDPQISFKGTGLKNISGKRSLLIRPDVALIKNSITNCFFDIKTDLGYKRNELLNQAKNRNKQLSKIKKKPASYNDGKTKIENKIQISNNIKLIYIVISQGNIAEKKLNKFIKDIRKLKNIDIFLLSKGDHLNSYVKRPKWEINKNDFDKLDRIIDRKLNK